MRHLVFFLEEPSARDLLQGLLPKIVPESIYVQYLVFEGKQDLEAQLVRKMRGWKMPNSAFIVLRDQDAADCAQVKATLAALVAEADRSPTLIRIACRELEAWVLGDWQAVADAFERPDIAGLGRKEQYRLPDQHSHPVDLIRKHLPEYQKRDGARRVGALLDPARNQSHSFKVFCDGLRRLVAPNHAHDGAFSS